MKILALYDKSGPKYHRILLPVYGLQQQGADVKVTYYLTEADFEGVDIVFFNRVIAAIDLPTLLKYREKYGFKLVCDLDDHWILNKEHILYQQYKEYKISQQIHDYIVNSNVVTVTHERLRDEVVRFNGNCHILPNAIPKIDQFLIDKYPSKEVRLFWAGGVTHRRDLELLRRPLQLIKRDKVRLIISGFVHGEPEWREMAKIFTTDSAYNTNVLESLPVHEYYKAYSHCDISLIPLVDNEFNRHKSNLKILEAANIGVPVVVSRVHPYLDFPEHLVNYVDAHKPWYAQINRLLKDDGLRRQQGAGLQAYCDIHYNFDKINEQRKQIFDETIQQGQTRETPTEAKRVA